MVNVPNHTCPDVRINTTYFCFAGSWLGMKHVHCSCPYWCWWHPAGWLWELCCDEYTFYLVGKSGKRPCCVTVCWWVWVSVGICIRIVIFLSYHMQVMVTLHQCGLSVVLWSPWYNFWFAKFKSKSCLPCFWIERLIVASLSNDILELETLPGLLSTHDWELLLVSFAHCKLLLACPTRWMPYIDVSVPECLKTTIAQMVAMQSLFGAKARVRCG